MKLIVAITGSSGVNLGLKFIKLLPKTVDIFLIISTNAYKAYKLENNKKITINSKNITLYQDDNLGAPIASGSFKVDKMIIIPCSMNSLAKFANGFSDTLIGRVFSVMLKEKREIIVSPREMPFNTINLAQMHYLSTLGVVVAPPVLGYYSNQKTLKDMEKISHRQVV